MTWNECQLARFADTPCSGRLVCAHLIPRQVLRREGYARLIHDPRTFVMACGGPTGIGGHHGELDGYDLAVPRWALPPGLEDLAQAIGMDWFLDRRYGPQ
jgi:hypothetical protein